VAVFDVGDVGWTEDGHKYRRKIIYESVTPGERVLAV